MWIINKYTSSRTFALIGDETKDKAGKNQFAISIRWVTYKYLALAAVGQTDDATLKNVPICNGYIFLNVLAMYVTELQICMTIHKALTVTIELA